MKHVVTLTTALIFAVLALASLAVAAVPQMINYQGRLTDSAGDTLSGTYSMEFAIYDDSTGGTARWSEVHPSVTVTAGTFSVILGTAEPIDDSVFVDPTRWLGIQVGGDPELTPRTRLVSVGYSHRVSTVDGSTGGTISGDVAIQSDLTVSGKATIGGSHTHLSVGGFMAGTENYADGYQTVVGGGNFNSALGSQATVGGGFLNGAADSYATVAGGYSNLANLASAIGGGRYNYARGEYTTIAGGGGLVALDSNSVLGDYSSIGGGRRNAITGTESTIGGGNNNRANGDEATVGGGEDNEANAANATVGGGTGNVASGIESTISGGSHNVAYGYLSTVGGGYGNKCYGSYCVIPGGDRDTIATGVERSMAFGRSVLVSADYRVVFFEGSYHGRLGVNRDDGDGGILHPIHVGTNSSNGNGAHLTNGGTWTSKSSRQSKENFMQLDGKELLDKLSSVPVEVWNYKNTDERHIGPMAEDFVAAFDVGTIREDDSQRENGYLAAGDVAGVALAAVKELHKTQQELKEKVQRIEQLEAEMAQLETLVETILAKQDGGSETKAEFGMSK